MDRVAELQKPSIVSVYIASREEGWAESRELWLIAEEALQLVA
jgi:hypothetical protein